MVRTLALTFIASIYMVIVVQPAHADPYQSLVDSDVVKARLALVRDQVEQLVNQDVALPDAARADILSLLSASFDKGSMEIEIKERIEFEMDAEQAQQVLNWYQQDLGEKIIAIESSGLKSSPKSAPINTQARAIRIRQLDHYLGYTELQVSLLKSLRQLANLVVNAQIGTNEYSQAINDVMGALIEASQSRIQTRSETVLTRLYQPLSEPEMKAFAAFLDEAAARAFNRVMIDVFHETLLATITLAANRMVMR